jgi:hypothetical protein
MTARRRWLSGTVALWAASLAYVGHFWLYEAIDHRSARWADLLERAQPLIVLTAAVVGAWAARRMSRRRIQIAMLSSLPLFAIAGGFFALAFAVTAASGTVGDGQFTAPFRWLAVGAISAVVGFVLASKERDAEPSEANRRR